MRLTPELLLRAYALGIFPMAESREDPEVHWIDPELRGILPLEQFHLPRKLKRLIRRGAFTVTCNRDFLGVVRGCAERKEERPETWINETIEQLYGELHAMGFAHSVETWTSDPDGTPRLVGGLYGVALGSAFFGESMFTRVTDASKIALAHLVFLLRKGGFQLLDTQFTTPHLRQFGALDVPRDHYKALLSRALMASATLPEELSDAELTAALDSLPGADD
ncbi:MAG: leucyl/phenylalanyl-tRNA--protein transferase [Tistlia sp.]|uniref:leucyl/phenylalanyl-tRNA--protein transferase n=1 Tax=Tistlia sp. TaxID=3057121 RepID=UPI0034A28978